MGFAEDLLTDLDDNFLNTDEFAKTGTFTHSGGGPVSVKVQFWNEYQVSDPLRIEAENLNPFAFGKASDFSGAVKNDTLAIDGVTYYIGTKEPDGMGMVKLNLSRSQWNG